MMRKAVMAGLVCAAAIAVSVPVYAHETHETYGCGGKDCAENECFLDEDGDGVCDNALCVDADGNRVCGVDAAGIGCGGEKVDVCRYYVDENEDGKCDHCVRKETYARRHHGHRSGHHGRHH